MFNTTFDLVMTLTDRVMGWYGFTHASDYRLLPHATRVAVELVSRNVTPDTLTREEIENADTATSSAMRQMWEAVNGPGYPFSGTRP